MVLKVGVCEYQFFNFEANSNNKNKVRIESNIFRIFFEYEYLLFFVKLMFSPSRDTKTATLLHNKSHKVKLGITQYHCTQQVKVCTHLNVNMEKG